MPDAPYSRFSSEDLILRDLLAIDRTVLANERTLLAYARTALALVVVGASAIKFFDSAAMTGLGVGFVIVGVLTGLFGGWRFVAVQRRVTAAARRATGPGVQG